MLDIKTEARFWAKVDLPNHPDWRNDQSCWPWIGAKDKDGYGRFWDGSRLVCAHREALELTVGKIDPKLEVMHTVCDNPPCCNPAHLKQGTHSENIREMYAKGRWARRPRENHNR